MVWERVLFGTILALNGFGDTYYSAGVFSMTVGGLLVSQVLTLFTTPVIYP
jgi:multidrug efflux pump subunit AcrB